MNKYHSVWFGVVSGFVDLMQDCRTRTCPQTAQPLLGWLARFSGQSSNYTNTWGWMVEAAVVVLGLVGGFALVDGGCCGFAKVVSELTIGTCINIHLLDTCFPFWRLLMEWIELDTKAAYYNISAAHLQETCSESRYLSATILVEIVACWCVGVVGYDGAAPGWLSCWQLDPLSVCYLTTLCGYCGLMQDGLLFSMMFMTQRSSSLAKHIHQNLDEYRKR